MPYDQNDDTIIRNGPLKTWLAYKVWGIKGQWIVAAVLVLGAIIGHKL